MLGSFCCISVPRQAGGEVLWVLVGVGGLGGHVADLSTAVLVIKVLQGVVASSPSEKQSLGIEGRELGELVLVCTGHHSRWLGSGVYWSPQQLASHGMYGHPSKWLGPGERMHATTGPQLPGCPFPTLAQVLFLKLNADWDISREEPHRRGITHGETQ